MENLEETIEEYVIPDNVWQHGYIHGDYDLLKSWEAATFGEGDESSFDGTLTFRSSAIYPMQEGSLVSSEEGEYKTYERIPNRNDVLILFAVRGKGVDLIPELEKLDNVTVHQNTGKAEIIKIYPEYALGQAVPYL